MNNLEDGPSPESCRQAREGQAKAQGLVAMPPEAATLVVPGMRQLTPAVVRGLLLCVPTMPTRLPLICCYPA